MALKHVIFRWALPTLSIFLGFFFFFSGILKLWPTINRDIHREIRRNFVQYVKFIPFAQQFNIKVAPSTYRVVVGYTEVICGLVLAFLNGGLKYWVNIFLIVFMSGAIYTHRAMDDSFARILPAIVITAFLFIRLFLHIRERRQIQSTNSAKYLKEQADLKKRLLEKANSDKEKKSAKKDKDELTNSESSDKSPVKEKKISASKKKSVAKKAKKAKEN